MNKELKTLALILLLLSAFSCNEKKNSTAQFSFFLSDKTMILNAEQDNGIEGTYIKILEADEKKNKIKIKKITHFFITPFNFKNWAVGWGNNKTLADAGNENLRSIEKIDQNGIITLSKLIRGQGFPKKGQNIVFWNLNPSGFIKTKKNPVIDITSIPQKKGTSFGLSALAYDSLNKIWTMYVQELDTNATTIFAFNSKDLNNWKLTNDKNPIITLKDFNNVNWINNNSVKGYPLIPIITDVIKYNNNWYLLFQAFDTNKKLNIGLIKTPDLINGPFNINSKPIIPGGNEKSWNSNGSFGGKFCLYKNQIFIFFDGINHHGEENIGSVKSTDLINWTENKNNPLKINHIGWRSSLYSGEPAYIKINGDSITLLVAGAKNSKTGFWHHYITGKIYKAIPGNIYDIELGAYLSTDNGKSFIPHKNNPLLINDYSDQNENDHLGAALKFIKTDSIECLFYQAKSLHDNSYNIYMRTRSLKF